MADLVRLLERFDPTNRIWFAERDLPDGEDIQKRIARELKTAKVLLFCASAATSGERRGVLLAKEQELAARRLRSDPSFRICSVRIGTGAKIPTVFRKMPTFDLARGNWRHKVETLADALMGRSI